MSDANFAIAFYWTLELEGVYSNAPSDFGGETCKGISRKKWPDWDGWKIVDRIKKTTDGSTAGISQALNESTQLSALVKEFYKRNFYDVLKLDQIDNGDIVCELFDTAVNQGTRTAGMYFQEALNLLNDNGRFYPDLTVDGIPGAKTISAYRAFMNTDKLPGRSEIRNTMTLLVALNGLQFEKYREIVKKNPGQETFFYGWLSNRVSI